MLIVFFLLFVSPFGCHFFTEDNLKFTITVDEISPYDNPSETYRHKLKKNFFLINYFRYYSLPFCQPDYVYEQTQTLGENLSGDRKMNSLYDIEYKGKIVIISDLLRKILSECDRSNHLQQKFHGP
jgi:hypothetical protein